MTDFPAHRASIEDVARRAGVSSGTVSRALRGLPNVSTSTRAKVLAAADELNYIASPSASSLASGKMSTVGVVSPYVSRWFFSQVIGGINEALMQAGFDLVLYIDEDGQLFEKLPMRRRVDAVLLLTLPAATPDVARLVGMGIPVGTIGVALDGFSSVMIDDVAGAKMAVNHLIGLGHERIAMIGSATNRSLPFTAPENRRTGYRQALAAASVEWDGAFEVEADPTVAGGQEAASQILALPHRPTAIFAETDEMAMGVLHTLRRAGLQCPEDISVIGFDGHDMAGIMDLTTVVQPAYLQGKRLAELVLEQVLHGHDPRSEVVGTRLAVRGTTSPPAAVSH